MFNVGVAIHTSWDGQVHSVILAESVVLPLGALGMEKNCCQEVSLNGLPRMGNQPILGYILVDSLQEVDTEPVGLFRLSRVCRLPSLPPEQQTESPKLLSPRAFHQRESVSKPLRVLDGPVWVMWLPY